MQRQQQGVVLIAVLWMVAALSIIATGVAQSVRNEIRMVSGAKQLTQASALGDAAVNIVLQMLVSMPEKPTRVTYYDLAYRGVQFHVEVRPNNGLVSLNTASALLLQSLLTYGADLDANTSEQLANAIVAARSQKDAKGRPNSFEAIEDLLSVPGVTYSLYAKIKPLLTTDQSGSGRINPMAAPEELLRIMANGDSAKASQIVQSRDSGGVGIDTTSLNAMFLDNTSIQRFRIHAKVPMGDGRWVRVIHVADTSPNIKDGIPWRTISIERSFEPMAMKGI